MVRHNTLLALRNFKKYSSSFAVNLIGLSTGMACVILAYLWVSHELSIDKFHEKEGRIFQVMRNEPEPDMISTSTSTAGLLASALKDEFPEVEYSSSVITPDWFENEKGIVTYENQSLLARGQLAESDYLRIFSWKLIRGQVDEVFSDKYAVIISEELAKTIFGSSENAMGKIIEWAQESSDGKYQITGVFENIPENSTAQFDLLFNYRVFYENKKKNLDHWGNSNPDTYLLLKENVDSERFNEKIKNFTREKFSNAYGTQNLKYIGEIFIRHFSDGYLYNTYENGKQAGGRINYIWLFSLIAIFIIGIASINFINLTTARVSRRTKEIGIKKTVGANRVSLVFQFLVESFIIALFSMILGLVMVYLILPNFNLITGKQLTLSFQMLLPLLLLTIFVGLLAGTYPAFYLSHFKPVNVLKGSAFSNSMNSISEKIIRKGLVVFQFAVSIALIVGVVVIFKQIEFIQTKNLGYNDENIIEVHSSGKVLDDTQTFINEVKKIPGVLNASAFGHDMVGDVGSTGGLNWPGREPNQRIRFGNLEVGHNWIELLDIELIEGRTYTNNYKAEHRNIIFNESGIKAMGLENPIGTKVNLWGEERIIIGVVKDFNFQSLYDEIMPCFIQIYPDLASVLIKVDGSNMSSTIASIQEFHTEYNGGLPFDFQFMDDDYQQLYVAEQRVATLSKYFAGIAIVISSLGLLALAAFSIERRRKEIGIRKVLGSSAFNIVKLLSSDFVKMVMIAILISLPFSYYLAEEWLSSFAFRIQISWWWFALSGLTALAIAVLTVSLQTLRAANLNPVISLKEE